MKHKSDGIHPYKSHPSRHLSPQTLMISFYHENKEIEYKSST